MCKPHLFWGVSDRNLAFSKHFKPMSCCCFTGLKCVLEQGWTEAHTCTFCCRCFLKLPSLGDLLSVLPFSRPKFHVFVSQSVSPRWHSSSGACSGLPATPPVPHGEEVWPHAEWSKLPTLGLELLELRTIRIIHGTQAPDPFCQQQWWSINCRVCTPCWDWY